MLPKSILYLLHRHWLFLLQALTNFSRDLVLQCIYRSQTHLQNIRLRELPRLLPRDGGLEFRDDDPILRYPDGSHLPRQLLWVLFDQKLSGYPPSDKHRVRSDPDFPVVLEETVCGYLQARVFDILPVHFMYDLHPASSVTTEQRVNQQLPELDRPEMPIWNDRAEHRGVSRHLRGKLDSAGQWIIS